jgi:predicted kinase
MLFLMRGTSCSGKGTLIKKHFEPHTVLSSDWYRQVLTNDITNQQQNGLVFQTIDQLLEHRLKNRLPYTVIDATNIKLKSAAGPLELAEKYGEKVTVISIDPPELNELIRRSEQRASEGGLYVPEEVLHRHWEGYWTSMPAFIERAAKGNDNEFTFIRIDQNYDVVQELPATLKGRLKAIEASRRVA